MQITGTRIHVIQLTILASVTAWSLVRPYDMLTWTMEAAPAIIVVIILAATYRKFTFTGFIYWCVLVHCIILLVGAHYTYARVPLFDWIREWLSLSRNNYDKVGHLAQGFFPALVVRELLLRTSPLKKGKWLFFLVVCVCLAASAFYEFIEWWAGAAMGGSADDFLGTQGYAWDTQSDMFLAMTGAMLAQILFSRYQDRRINEL